MARPPRLKIKLTSESLNELLQESYRELAEQRNVSLRQYNQQLLSIKIKPDPLMSKTNADLLKIIDSTIEKKISIARLLKDIVFSDGNNKDINKNGELSIEERKAVFEAINKEGSTILKDKIEKKNIDFDFGDLSNNDEDSKDDDISE